MNISKRFVAIASAAVLSLFAGQSMAADKLVIGTDSTYPPFEYLDAGGNFLGFDMDIGRALCAQMKVECTFVSMISTESFRPCRPRNST